MTIGARAVQKNGEEKSLVLNVQRNRWIIVNQLKVKIFFKSIFMPRSKLLGSFPSERDLVICLISYLFKIFNNHVPSEAVPN